MVKDTNTRFLQVEDLLERSEDGLQFKKRFKSEEILVNKHYLIKDKNIILQVNTDYRNIGCHDVGFDRVVLSKMSEDMWLTLLKNVILSGMKFNMSLDIEDEDDESYFRYDLEVLDQGKSTPEDYLNRIIENKDELLGVLGSIVVYNRESGYQIQIYSSGATVYRKIGQSEKEYHEDVKLLVGQLLGNYESLEELEEIKMLEKEIVQHPYSKLYLLMDYLKENKDELPKEVRDALDIGLEEGLTKMGESYRDANIYVNK